jgi:hypothetical protein
MSTKSKIIALGTALAIGAGAFATTANAAPLGGLSANLEIGTAVDTVGGKKLVWKPKPTHPWHPHKPHKHHGWGHGEAAMIGLGAFALGAAIASSQAQGGYRNCYSQDVKIWSNKYQAYVIKTQTVCD